MAEETVADIVQECLRTIGETEADDATIGMVLAALNRAHDSLCGKARWDFLETSCVLDITSTTVALAVPNGTTVTDTDGNVAPRCRNLVSVQLDSIGRHLTFRPLPVNAIRSGALAYLPRGTPLNYALHGRQLYTIPLPGATDTLTLWYVAGHSNLTLTSTPLIPEDWRHVLINKTIAGMTSREGFDVRIQAHAREEAKEDLADMMLYCNLAFPDFFAQQLVEGDVT